MTDNNIKRAIAYVRENMEPYELAAIDVQIDEAYERHLMPEDTCEYGHVIDLLNEYGFNHDLVEDYFGEHDWWEDNGNVTINDILFEL